MKEETWRFIAELIRTNQPVTEIVDADFTYLNAGLARLYELPTVSGDHLQRLNLPADSSRRACSVKQVSLTITANVSRPRP